MSILKDGNVLIRLEVTNHCNLKCPHCARIPLKNNYKLNSNYLSLKEIKRWLPIIFLDEYSPKFLFSGLVGEPTINPEFLYIIEYLSKYSSVRIDSNGSTNDETWWKSLGEYKVQCTFSPDSLVSKNNQYRINSNTEKVISNMKAFISSGGSAIWKYIPFKHNEDELEEQKKYAKKLGANFVMVQPGRFNEDKINPEVKSSKYFPSSKKKVKPSYVENQSPIHYCKLFDNVDRTIEIGPDGVIYPCAFTGRYFFITYSDYFTNKNPIPKIYEEMLSDLSYKSFVNDIIPLIENQGGVQTFSLYHNTFEEILETDFFKFSLQKSWEIGNEYCSKYCSARDYVFSRKNIIINTDRT